MASQAPATLPAGPAEQATLSRAASLSPWWRQAAAYVAAGIDICRKDVFGLLALVGLFAIPPLVTVIVGKQPDALAAWTVASLPWLTITLPGSPAAWAGFLLPWITITFGNISVVLAVEAIDAGQPVILRQILPATVRWWPRYFWANTITTILFWGLFDPAQWGLGPITARWGWPSYSPVLLLLLPMLFWHVRLVFATYAAIVDDQPGIRSVRISIGIAHRRWKMAAAAFALSVLVEAPIAGPLYLLILQITNPVVAGGYTWVLVMAMRPIFIATLHEIYQDYRPAAAIAESQKHDKPTLGRAIYRRLGGRSQLAPAETEALAAAQTAAAEVSEC